MLALAVDVLLFLSGRISSQDIILTYSHSHWFYEDFLRPLNPSLASFSLRRFSSYLLHTSSLTVPLIQKYISPSASGKKSQQDLEAAFDEFMKYKTRVPVCGVVMLNRGLDKVRGNFLYRQIRERIGPDVSSSIRPVCAGKRLEV